jgi:hypothetical protein
LEAIERAWSKVEVDQAMDWRKVPIEHSTRYSSSARWTFSLRLATGRASRSRRYTYREIDEASTEGLHQALHRELDATAFESSTRLHSRTTPGPSSSARLFICRALDDPSTAARQVHLMKGRTVLSLPRFALKSVY